MSVWQNVSTHITYPSLSAPCFSFLTRSLSLRLLLRPSHVGRQLGAVAAANRRVDARSKSLETRPLQCYAQLSDVVVSA